MSVKDKPKKPKLHSAFGIARPAPIIEEVPIVWQQDIPVPEPEPEPEDWYTRW